MFDQLVEFGKAHPIQSALYASLFTWGLTASGAALVFFFKKASRAVLDGMLGFTGGVMVAASFWSLLSPAIENSSGEGFIKVIPSAVGFALGAVALFGLDKLMPHLHINFKKSEAEGIKTQWHRTTLLVLAITLHNIPEGLAVGVLFGAAATLVGAEQTHIRDRYTEFPRRICCINAIKTARNFKIKKLLVWTIICRC
jgi:ZIP family zinc transporter